MFWSEQKLNSFNKNEPSLLNWVLMFQIAIWNWNYRCIINILELFATISCIWMQLSTVWKIFIWLQVCNHVTTENLTEPSITTYWEKLTNSKSSRKEPQLVCRLYIQKQSSNLRELQQNPTTTPQLRPKVHSIKPSSIHVYRF